VICSSHEILDRLKPTQTTGFIVFEGINGAGKSTLIQSCTEYLKSLNREHICTREPGGTGLGKELRKLLLERPDIPRSEFAEMLLFSADRSQHLSEVILPALARNEIVLCDRYLYSTTAFQGYGRGIELRFIAHCHELATRGVQPDFVVLLDIEPALAMQRLGKRSSSEGDVFESEELAFHQRVRDGFLAQAHDATIPFLVLNAQEAPAKLALEVQGILNQY
jgi:dTMP kinase